MARILIIDDNASIVESLGYFLESVGHSVVRATNGQAGLQCVADQPVDVVLLDIEMPGMSGFAVCRALHNDPASRDLPVVMMTGRAVQETISPAKAAGARLVMGKPFDLDYLNATLARFLPAAPTSAAGCA